ncbi:hypothetical protein GQX73_g9831 [Xylaria multiplex]|uniref:Uncharacterized protein n=1 Tax=Xylaria multiplex TaxID=323545 RepID=A0A7C8IHP2_9PEZI|nr:hypothetical protein GQX73_g9831 [Xylaria multiplex]
MPRRYYEDYYEGCEDYYGGYCRGGYYYEEYYEPAPTSYKRTGGRDNYYHHSSRPKCRGCSRRREHCYDGYCSECFSFYFKPPKPRLLVPGLEK